MNETDAVSPPDAASDRALERVVRAETGHIVASLTASLGNFDLAEEAVAEAIIGALVHWCTGAWPESLRILAVG